jgi:hypothetical protein
MTCLRNKKKLELYQLYSLAKARPRCLRTGEYCLTTTSSLIENSRYVTPLFVETKLERSHLAMGKIVKMADANAARS